MATFYAPRAHAKFLPEMTSSEGEYAEPCRINCTFARPPVMASPSSTNTARIPRFSLLAGASGYSFKEWKGNFYPEKIKPEEMLAYYAERLPTVEINNTFYRMPKVAVLESWDGSTPGGLRFAIKPPRRITHMPRLKVEAVADSVDFLYRNLAAPGPKRGAVLFQLPPNLK